MLIHHLCLADCLPFLTFGHPLGEVFRAPLPALYELTTSPTDRLDFNNSETLGALLIPYSLEYETLRMACRVQEEKTGLLWAALRHNWVYADAMMREGDRKRRQLLVRKATLQVRLSRALGIHGGFPGEKPPIHDVGRI